MCEYCHQAYCCVHGHHGGRYMGPGQAWPAWGPPPFEPGPAARREYYEEEKATLERRLKILEARLAVLEK